MLLNLATANYFPSRISFLLGSTSGATAVPSNHWRDCFKHIFCFSSCCKSWQATGDIDAADRDIHVELTLVTDAGEPTEDSSDRLISRETPVRSLSTPPLSQMSRRRQLR